MDPPKYTYSLVPPQDLADDFIGYGENPVDPEWPNGSRIAVSIVLLLKDNKQKYACRVGCWRILKMMKEYGVPITICGHAEAFQLLLDLGRAGVRDGHEIANHGSRPQMANWLLSSDEELLSMIKNSIKTIEEVTGVQPVGTYIGGCTSKVACIAAQAHKEVGIPLMWSSDEINDDLPYWADLPQERHFPDSEKSGLLMIPYSYDVHNLSFYKAHTGIENGNYKNQLINEFNQLYHEGGKVMSVPLHTEIMGKPALAQELREFIEYIREKDGVWVSTRKDIALHWRRKFPYSPNAYDSKK